MDDPRPEIRVADDDDYLYLGTELYDDRPDDVRAGSLYRDRYSGDDTVGIVIDSFNDNRNRLVFYTTPAGMRSDATVIDDMASGESDTSWNGYLGSPATAHALRLVCRDAHPVLHARLSEPGASCRAGGPRQRIPQ